MTSLVDLNSFEATPHDIILFNCFFFFFFYRITNMDLSLTECRLIYMLEEEKKDMSQKRLKIKLIQGRP